MEPKNLSDRLKALRHAKHLRIREVAAATGITESYLSRLESGARQQVSREKAETLAAFFTVSAEWIIGGIETDPIKAAQSATETAIEESGLLNDAEVTMSRIALWLRSLITGAPELQSYALLQVQQIAKEFAETCQQKNRPVRKASAELTRKMLQVNSQVALDISKQTDTVRGEMNEHWPALLARIKTCLKNSSQNALAKQIGVSRQSIHQYLAGTSAPSAEKTLQLLQWVEDMERRQNEGPEVVRATPEPKTRTKKPDNNELSSSPKQT